MLPVPLTISASLPILGNGLTDKKMGIKVSIESHAGFCSGVNAAIKQAEDVLLEKGSVYCLGEIVHNKAELARLVDKGLLVINYTQFENLKNATVLIRAHGEPPETYQIARKNNIELLDASCPIVKKLQFRIKNDFEKSVNTDFQVVIYGNAGHAEVIGLSGQISHKAILVKEPADLLQIDFRKPVRLYSQTTMGIEGYRQIASLIEEQMLDANKETMPELQVNNTVCKQVSRLVPYFTEFAKRHQIIIFVSGKSSSNGKYLYNICKQANANTFMVAGINELCKEWFDVISYAGICGATSTPHWLMQEIADFIENNF